MRTGQGGRAACAILAIVAAAAAQGGAVTATPGRPKPHPPAPLIGHDQTPPMLVPLSPEEGATYTFQVQVPGGDLDYVLTASEPLGFATWAVDGGDPEPLAAVTPTDWTSPAGAHPSLSRGAHALTYTAQDLAGNPAILKVTFMIVLETTCVDCADCTARLDGSYDTVTLAANIRDWPGTCVTFGGSGVTFDGGGHVIDGVIIYPTITYGIWLNGQSDVTARNCEVSGFWYGVYSSPPAGTASGAIVEQCNVHDCAEGLLIYRMPGSIVRRSVFTGNTNDGLGVGQADDLVVQDNLVLSNGLSGLFVAFGGNALVEGNVVVGNGLAFSGPGLALFGNTGVLNVVRSNVIMMNAIQVEDEGANQLDGGYPAGGNYWTDFDAPSEGCIDLYSGPGQDQPGPDGICDAPYVNGNAIDHYPLVRPPTCTADGAR